MNMKSAKDIVRAELADDVFATAIEKLSFFAHGIDPDGDYPDEKLTPEAEDEVAKLVSKRCNSRSLRIILTLCRYFPAECIRSVTPIDRLKTLASKMQNLAKEIDKVESREFLSALDQMERSRWLMVWEGFGINLPSSRSSGRGRSKTRFYDELATALLQRASAYNDWAELVRQHAIPRDFGPDRLRRLFVMSYVKYATRDTCFPEVLQLLKDLGLFRHNTTQQMSRELKQFERDYPRSNAELRSLFARLDSYGITAQFKPRVARKAARTRR